MTGRRVAWGEFAALPARDRSILRDLARVRLLTGSQIERLHFHELGAPRTRGSSRRRTMQRLQALHLVTTLSRRIGGERAGSAGLIYTLDAAGQHLAASSAPQLDRTSPARTRRPWAVGYQFVQHSLDVSELYTRFSELERSTSTAFRLVRFDAEPASWHRAANVLLKPDAFAEWRSDGWEEHRWIEVDRATESMPTLNRKLLAYVDAARAGAVGPGGLLPRVVVTVPDQRRLTAVSTLVHDLPQPGAELVGVMLFADYPERSLSSGANQQARPPPME